MIKAYQQDWAYTEHWDLEYDQEQASKIMKKLLRHFKLKYISYRFELNKKGRAYYGHYILLPKNGISLGMICHEIGHQLAYVYGIKGHTKKAYKYIHRIYKYANKYLSIKI